MISLRRLATCDGRQGGGVSLTNVIIFKWQWLNDNHLLNGVEIQFELPRTSVGTDLNVQ